MNIIGHATQANLAKLAARGVGPKDAVDAILAEAKARTGQNCIIVKSATGGFDIVALA